MKQIWFSKKEIEGLVTEHLEKQGEENFVLFSHTGGVTAYVKQNDSSDPEWLNKKVADGKKK